MVLQDSQISIDSAAMQLRLSRNKWIGRLAAAGFLFFLVKGLVWLAVGGLALAAVV
jgi:hypothetical protein